MSSKDKKKKSESLKTERVKTKSKSLATSRVEGSDKPFVEHKEYNGNEHPIIHLPFSATSAHSFSFGLSKAKLILENVSAIEKFVAEYGKD